MENKTLLQDDQERQRSQELSQATKPPGHVPGYDLEKRLGEGAFGEVWLGTERNTGMKVAVKFYTRRGKGDWSQLPREVEKLAFLANDRRVVQLKAVGWDADPPYYVMEHLDQGSLEDRLQRGSLEVDAAVDLFREVGVALAHAHGKGVLHCDLKPGNVLLDQDQKPRLCDFGQSRLATEFTHALGTLFYMAPEQANLKASPDVRWDVYALGALLYCMLTGDPPYRTDEAVGKLEAASSLEDRLACYQQIIATAPPPTLHRRVPGVDKRLADVVDRCLAVQPGKRFANVQAVLTALDHRARARARRPLLVLSVFGPILFLSVITFAMTKGFVTAIDEQTNVLKEKSLDGNAFAARFVSQAVGAEITRRWQALEQEADDDELQEALAGYNLHRANGNELGMKQAQEEIEAWMERARLNYENVREETPEHEKQAVQRGIGKSASWFLNDAIGTQVARHPKGVGRDNNYAHRDYFHGQGVDYLPAMAPEPPVRTSPTRKSHLSVAFVSSTTGNPVVAFSVPVFARRADRAKDEPIGVLAMTVELGRFTEIHSKQNQMICLADTKPDTRISTCTITTAWPGAQESDVEKQITRPFAAALAGIEHTTLSTMSQTGKSVVTVHVDTDLPKKDSIWREIRDKVVQASGRLPSQAEKPIIAGRPGALLEHPALADLVKARRQSGKPPQFYYLDDDLLAKLEPMCNSVDSQLTPLTSADYGDPIGASGQERYRGTWLAAVAPVIAKRSEGSYPTGWVVVVQEQQAQAVQPVKNLSSQLRWQAITAGLLLLGAVFVLWGFVYLVLRGPSKTSWLRSLRHRIGLPTSTAGMGSSRAMGSSAPQGVLTPRSATDATSNGGKKGNDK